MDSRPVRNAISKVDGAKILASVSLKAHCVTIREAYDRFVLPIGCESPIVAI